MVQIITVEHALQQQGIFIDTRTPLEYEEDHLPNAINIPVISNEERVIVGTQYVKESHDFAIKTGMDYFNKNLPGILHTAEPYKSKSLFVYCWRGGLRSKIVAEALEHNGFKVYQIQGGYKAYRAYVQDQLRQYKLNAKIIVLYGLTGCGKTALLHTFSNSIDLEDCAGHRGSVYGGIGLKQHTQKKFENLLWQKLEQLHNERFILVEGESKRIGDCYIPDFLWNAMNHGIAVKIQCSIQKRVAVILNDYFNTPEKKEEMSRITKKLTQNIPDKKQIIACFDNKEYAQGTELLLTKYYDPLYNKYLDTLTYVVVINNDIPEQILHQLSDFIHQCS
ncbi:MAG: tRNA 2-selenouridine(34) synthase MnmH [Candidatus Woesearchaeota archaeon]